MQVSLIVPKVRLSLMFYLHFGELFVTIVSTASLLPGNVGCRQLESLPKANTTDTTYD